MLERHKLLDERFLSFSISSVVNFDRNLRIKLGLEERKIKKEDTERIFNIIYSNNLMAQILNSGEYQVILEEEKKLKGEAKLGVVFCIDGRIPQLFMFGRSANAREKAGSLIALDEAGNLEDERFISILEQTANDRGGDFLQIVTAHTSLHDKSHGCGAIKKGIDEGIFPEGDIDQIALKEASKRAHAIEKKYNEILKTKGKPPLEKVAITAMIDTDTMGLILNFGSENNLSTTNIVKELTNQVIEGISFGEMRDKFTDPKNFIEYSQKILTLTKYFIENRYFDEYVNNNYGNLTDAQKLALIFTLARVSANQFLTGLATNSDDHHEPSHPFAKHNEDYMVVSPHGKPLGRFDISHQSFGSVPSSREEMIDEVKIKISLLKTNGGQKPHILFLSTPVPLKDYLNNSSVLTSVQDAAIEYFKQLISDDKILDLIKSGELLIVPVFVNEDNGEVLEVKDYSIYIN
jgi:hypothetical protein